MTGGTLLARDREFIVLYRGKDFLPLAVSSALEERRKHVMHKKKLGTDHNTPVGPVQGEAGTSVSGSDEPTRVEDNKVKHLPEQRKASFAEASVERTNVKLAMVCSFGVVLLPNFSVLLAICVIDGIISGTGLRKESKSRATSSRAGESRDSPKT